MNDQIADYLLEDLDVRRDTVFLQGQLEDLLMTGHRFEHAVLISTALAFAEACEMMDIDDEFGALEQILDKFPDGVVDLSDDPAKGRFIHSAGHA